MDIKEIEMIWRRQQTQIETINERTKNHTIEIRGLKKKVKKLEKQNEKHRS